MSTKLGMRNEELGITKRHSPNQSRSILGILVIAALLVTGCSKGKKSWSGGGSAAGGFKPVVVSRDDLQITVLATGNVQPHNQLSIKPPISGRIEKLMITEGAYVKKGQVLAQLSSTERATLLDAARAQGPDVLAHWEGLYTATPLLSPENGQIVYLPTVPGQIVAQSDSIMTMSDHLIVNTQVDETDLAQIKMNQDATITLDAYPSDPIDGKVQRISYQSTLVNNVTTYEVDVWPTKVPAFMRSGMTANVVFEVAEKENVLVVPSEAIQQRGDQSVVLMAGAKPTDKPTPQPIQTGITDGKETEVVSGLNEGDKILIKTFSASQVAPTSAGTNPFMPGGAKTGGGHGH